MTAMPDPELAILIAEAIDAGLLLRGTPLHQLACTVATKGVARLSRDERARFEAGLLPLIARPIPVPAFAPFSPSLRLQVA